MKYLLWLDDLRDPEEDNWLSYSPIAMPFQCIWVKNYYEFTNWILKNGLPDAICFDHDLGTEQIIDTEGNLIDKEKTGYDCAKWVVNYCLDHHLRLPKWNIQSANPVGKANINGLLLSFSKNVL